MINIILVGMPASGKTTIGQLLASELPQYTLIDTDSVIEKTQGLTVSEIFEKFSEDYFRKLEYDTIKMVCRGTNKIISVGGGAFENPDNRATLLKFGKVFYLKSDLDVLYYRISEDKTRPLLQRENPKQILENLLKKREENYKKAHYTIDTTSLNQEEIVRFILNETNA
ncbi:shikimate kinase [bacterium]|nr:shikimate kinase [bacterium]